MTTTHRKIAQACAAAFLLAGLSACGDADRSPGSTAKSAKPNEPSPSAVVIGQAPAEPTAGEPAGTSPVAPNTTEISKRVESNDKPQEGDNHSYSTLAPVTPQKAEGANVSGDGGSRSTK